MGLLYDATTRGLLPHEGRTSTCRGCGDAIVWIKTVSGKSMPCDVSPVYYRMTGDGNEKIVTPNGVVLSCEIVTDPNRATGFGYVPHWSTCSKADRFRKRNGVENNEPYHQ